MQMSLFDRRNLGDLNRHPLADAFWNFHQENPRVYKSLEDMALRTKQAGKKKYSIRTLYHVLRWNSDLDTTDKEFKLNDHHTPFYARLLMKTNPVLKDFFEVRNAAADKEA